MGCHLLSKLNTMNWKLSTSIWMLVSFVAVGMLSSCAGGGKSGATGWSYNDPTNGGFEDPNYYGQETGPGLVFIEGGTFTMGQVEDDLMFEWDNMPRRVTVSSFYMDETEVTNAYWLEYTYWLQRVYGSTYPEIVQRSLPDTLAWRNKLAYNEPYVNYYLRHPSYRDYPVVGISWLQANEFCKWRSDRVNEQILVREGLIVHNPEAQVDEEHFTTETYLAGQYQPEVAAEGVRDLRPGSSGFRNVKVEDGLMLPQYRLPTEAEWEFAALGLIGNSYDELISERRTYPWNGHFTRNGDNRSRYTGEMQGNFIRGRGDMMGVAGALNDGADITAPVYAYAPNDYGLYNMAGNVSEWCMDVYRPLNHMESAEFRPFRGNVYQTLQRDSEGLVQYKYDFVVYEIDSVEAQINAYAKAGARNLIEEDLNLIDNVKNYIDQAKNERKAKREEEAQLKMDEAMDLIEDSESTIAPDIRDAFANNILALPGDLRYRDVKLEENLGRDNYRVADNIDYQDGDLESSIYYNDPSYGEKEGRMYGFGETSLINNQSRVYKGGGWDDRIYWVTPSARRYMDEAKSSASIGFRCAMDRVGSPRGLSQN